MRVLVCGDRNFEDYDLLERTLNEHTISTIIEGEARGADRMARRYGDQQNIPVIPFPADWNKYGKGAGPIRNKQMLVEGKPDLVVAFLAENSKGTRNMINQATEAGVAVRVINV